MSEITSAGSLVRYLRSRGQPAEPEVTVLTEGVSGETFLVETAPSRIVMKRALSRLRVGRRAGQIKVGSTHRSGHTAKWNRLRDLEATENTMFAGPWRAGQPGKEERQ